MTVMIVMTVVKPVREQQWLHARTNDCLSNAGVVLELWTGLVLIDDSCNLLYPSYPGARGRSQSLRCP